MSRYEFETAGKIANEDRCALTPAVFVEYLFEAFGDPVCSGNQDDLIIRTLLDIQSFDKIPKLTMEFSS